MEYNIPYGTIIIQQPNPLLNPKAIKTEEDLIECLALHSRRIIPQTTSEERSPLLASFIGVIFKYKLYERLITDSERGVIFYLNHKHFLDYLESNSEEALSEYLWSYQSNEWFFNTLGLEKKLKALGLAKKRGVYLFASETNKLLYVGSSQDLSSRIATSLVERNPQVDGDLHLKWIFTDSFSDNHLLETLYIVKHKPALNKHMNCKDGLTFQINIPKKYKDISGEMVVKRYFTLPF